MTLSPRKPENFNKDGNDGFRPFILKGDIMPNSTLASYNADCTKRNPRNHIIDRLTPHYMAGNLGARQCADYLKSTERQASCNYCIGSDGSIAVCVPEDYRAWTSSSYENDCRAVTFECANIDSNGTLTDACYQALVKLSADVCKRHGFKPHYDGTTNGSITMHKQFAATSCPGNWLTQKIESGQYEKDVLAAMGETQASNPASGQLYRVRKNWNDAVSQIGAFRNLENAKKACKAGYKVFDAHGHQLFPDPSSSAETKKTNDTIAQEVINGKWGNGSDRITRLKAAGYDPNTIQALVNLKLGASSKKSVDAIAREVIAGKWGNGQDRINRLSKAGYNPTEVQHRVNQLLR